MLLRAMERTGGPEEDGVRGFKDELHAAVVTRLGEYQEDQFCMVATLLDPRYVCYMFACVCNCLCAVVCVNIHVTICMYCVQLL